MTKTKERRRSRGTYISKKGHIVPIPVGRPKRFTIEQVQRALMNNYGNKSAAARALKTGPETIGRYVRENPELEEAVQQGIENLVDLAQNKAVELIEAGDVATTIFVLKTQGKNRGFVERREVYQENQTEITVKAMDYREGLQALKPPDAEEAEFREIEMGGHPILPESDDDEEGND